MAGIPHDHYEPKHRREKWVERRLPVLGLLYNTLMIPTPKNLNWMWIWGIILTFVLVLQIVTGIILVMHYTPHVDNAFASVEHIMRNVNGGWALRYIHANGASLFFVAVYAHIFRNLYYGSYKAPREITWILGILIYLLMMGTAFMGYVLPWGQMSFWGATVITGLFGAIPFVGEPIQTWLLGGPAVDNATLNRFFSLHYLMPFLIAGLSVVKIWSFHSTGNNNPTGVEVRRTSKEEAQRDTLPFWPYFVMKDLLALAVILVVFFAIVGLHAELSRPPRQLHRGQPAGDAGAYRARMVLPAVLRDSARLHRGRLGRDRGELDHRGHHRREVLRRARHVRRDCGDGAGAVARHLLGALGALPSDVQMVVRAARRRLLRADVAGLHACRGALGVDLADRVGLLVHLLPGDPAAVGRDREANAAARDHRGRLRRALRARLGRLAGDRDAPARRARRLHHAGRMRDAMLRTIRHALAAFTLSTSAALAAGGEGHITDYAFPFETPFGTYDQNQLQRGLKVYTEVCSACHGIKYVAFRNLVDAGGVGFTEAQAKVYAEQFEVFDSTLNFGEGDFRAATLPDHFPENNSVGAPDLSLMAKSRAGFHGPWNLGINQIIKGMGGPEYIASLLAGYTGEEKEEAGSILYENVAFPGGWISMAPPLGDDYVTFDDGAPADLENASKDVAAFLMWTAEPKLAARKRMGLVAVIMLGVLSVLLYLTNKRIWAPVKSHGRYGVHTKPVNEPAE